MQALQQEEQVSYNQYRCEPCKSISEQSKGRKDKQPKGTKNAVHLLSEVDWAKEDDNAACTPLRPSTMDAITKLFEMDLDELVSLVKRSKNFKKLIHMSRGLEIAVYYKRPRLRDKVLSPDCSKCREGFPSGVAMFGKHIMSCGCGDINLCGRCAGESDQAMQCSCCHDLICLHGGCEVGAKCSNARTRRRCKSILCQACVDKDKAVFEQCSCGRGGFCPNCADDMIECANEECGVLLCDWCEQRRFEGSTFCQECASNVADVFGD